jgi:hypothetical protein
MLWEWRLTGLSDIAELLISELVTNAAQISRADGQITPVRLWVLADRTRVLTAGQAEIRAPSRPYPAP